MGMVSKQWIFLKNITRLIDYADSLGIVLTVGEAYRTEDQQILYYYGKRVGVTPGGKVYIKPGKKVSWTTDSYHMKRLAMDFNFFINGKLTYKKEDVQVLGDYWESLHEKNVWGGNWSAPDTPHFEMRL